MAAAVTLAALAVPAYMLVFISVGSVLALSPLSYEIYRHCTSSSVKPKDDGQQHAKEPSGLVISSLYKGFDKVADIVRIRGENECYSQDDSSMGLPYEHHLSQGLTLQSTENYKNPYNKKPGWAAYVFFKEGDQYKLSVCQHIKSKQHHSSLIPDEENIQILCAGMMKINKDGKIIAVDQASGHYRPTVTHFRFFLQKLEDFSLLQSLQEIKVSIAILPFVPDFIQIFYTQKFKDENRYQSFCHWVDDEKESKFSLLPAMVTIIGFATLLLVPGLLVMFSAWHVLFALLGGGLLGALVGYAVGYYMQRESRALGVLLGGLVGYAIVGLGACIAYPIITGLNDVVIHVGSKIAPLIATALAYSFSVGLIVSALFMVLLKWKMPHLKPHEMVKFSMMSGMFLSGIVGIVASGSADMAMTRYVFMAMCFIVLIYLAIDMIVAEKLLRAEAQPQLGASSLHKAKASAFKSEKTNLLEAGRESKDDSTYHLLDEEGQQRGNFKIASSAAN